MREEKREERGREERGREGGREEGREEGGEEEGRRGEGGEKLEKKRKLEGGGRGESIVSEIVRNRTEAAPLL